MRDIQIGQVLAQQRAKKGITQEELASYIGVSKASVSKWETGQSFPDITLLPQLATYFNITVDELLCYTPQMTGADVKKLYHSLSKAFTTEPVEQVLARCEEITKKYYACFPLLTQIAVLYINHYMLIQDEAERNRVLETAAELCRRVRQESDDVWLADEAAVTEGMSYVLMGRPDDTLELLGRQVQPDLPRGETIAMAYQALGNMPKAQEVVQINMYQHLATLANAQPVYIYLTYIAASAMPGPGQTGGDGLEKTRPVIDRALKLVELYDLEYLRPGDSLGIYHNAALVYCMAGQSREAIDMLRRYGELLDSDKMVSHLHGDAYFDLIDPWFAAFELGAKGPRDEKTNMKALVTAVTENPVFECLRESPEYKLITDKLQAAYERKC